MTKALETLTGADADAFDAAIAPRVSSVLSTVTANLATDIATATVPGAASAVRTSGYASIGRGAAIYVEDSLATAPLAAVHPLFCKTDAGGRRFRLLPDANGFLAASASGAVPTQVQDDSTNHRPALAALLAYAEAIDARGIQFDSGHYSIWAPLRTATNDNVNADQSGIPFVINKRIEFRAGSVGTQFNRRKFDGSDPAVFAGTQVLANFWDGGASPPAAVPATVYWRGGMFLLKGTIAAPANYADRAGLTLRGKWRIWGGLPKSATPGDAGWLTTYALGADGSGWDIRDKGVYAEADRVSGDITYDGDITIGGFRGELHFQAGRSCGSVYQYGKLRMHDTDGDGFNPNPWHHATDARGTLRMDHLEVVNTYNSLEGSTGWNSYIKRLDIRDCNQAQGLWAGTYRGVTLISGTKPVFTINSLHVERSKQFYVINGNRIDNAMLIDTMLIIGTNTGDTNPATGVGDGITYTGLGTSNVMVGNVTVIADTMNVSTGALWTGMGAAGVKGNANNRIRHLHCDRTPFAIAGGFKVTVSTDASGSIGSGCCIERITGFTSNPPKIGYTTGGSANMTDSHVAIRDMAQDAFTGAGTPIQNIETTPALTYYYGPRVTCSTTTNSGIWPVTLPDMTNKLDKGARYEIFNGMSVAVMAVNTNFSRLNRRAIIRPNTGITFEWDGGKWVLISQEQFLLGKLGATALQTAGAAIPANGTSDEVTFAVPGAVAGMIVVVVPDTILSADADFKGRVSSTGNVGIRARNMNSAATLTLVPTGYAAELRYAT